MSPRQRASGRSTLVKPRRGRTAGNGKTTDGDNLTATAEPGPPTRLTPPSKAAVVRLPRKRPAATKSTTAAPRRGSRRAELMPPPKRSDAIGVSASDIFRQRHPDSAVPSGLVRAQATPATRKRSREEGSRASAHSRSTSPNRTRRPDSSPSECSRTTDAPRSRLWRSVEAVVEWLKTHVHRLLDAVRDRGEVLTTKVQEWMDTLVEAVANGGAGVKAAMEGIRAALTGKNPVLAAIKGLVSGLSGQAKVAIVLLLALGLLLGPVLLVVLLLTLVVVALIAAVRAAVE
jgi:hypothetical protein